VKDENNLSKTLSFKQKAKYCLMPVLFERLAALEDMSGAGGVEGRLTW
jgi:hypothetical protein